jgi:hypothetical protein
MRAYNWIVQIGVLACSSRIQTILGFDREALKLGVGKTIMNADTNSIETCEGGLDYRPYWVCAKRNHATNFFMNDSQPV